MSIERQGYRFVPVCDTCGDSLESEAEFMEAVAAKAEAGWKSTCWGGEWEDMCCDCQRGNRE